MNRRAEWIQTGIQLLEITKYHQNEWHEKIRTKSTWSSHMYVEYFLLLSAYWITLFASYKYESYIQKVKSKIIQSVREQFFMSSELDLFKLISNLNQACFLYQILWWFQFSWIECTFILRYKSTFVQPNDIHHAIFWDITFKELTLESRQVSKDLGLAYICFQLLWNFKGISAALVTNQLSNIKVTWIFFSPSKCIPAMLFIFPRILQMISYQIFSESFATKDVGHLKS